MNPLKIGTNYGDTEVKVNRIKDHYSLYIENQPIGVKTGNFMNLEMKEAEMKIFANHILRSVSQGVEDE